MCVYGFINACNIYDGQGVMKGELHDLYSSLNFTLNLKKNIRISHHMLHSYPVPSHQQQ